MVGNTGKYIFDKNVLAETPLMSISHKGQSKYWDDATLIYGYYTNPEVEEFSQISNIEYSSQIARWNGNNED
jgi:hypothetical protein